MGFRHGQHAKKLRGRARRGPRKQRCRIPAQNDHRLPDGTRLGPGHRLAQPQRSRPRTTARPPPPPPSPPPPPPPPPLGCIFPPPKPPAPPAPPTFPPRPPAPHNQPF